MLLLPSQVYGNFRMEMSFCVHYPPPEGGGLSFPADECVPLRYHRFGLI